MRFAAFAAALCHAGGAAAVDLAVLPPANNTGVAEAAEIMLPQLYAALEVRGISVLPAAELRPLLRRIRSRSVGRVNGEDARLIGRETGAEHLLLVALDVYRGEANPEVGLTVRILDPERGVLVWGASAAAAGSDYRGFFGVGKVDSVAEVSARVIADLAGRLAEWRKREVRSDAGPIARVALVPLDNLTDYERGGAIASGILLTELLRAGFEVIEPGYLREFFFERQVMPRGGIRVETARALRTRFGAEFVITGALDLFRPARGGVQDDVPGLSFGLRVIETGKGRVLATFDDEVNGEEYERFFRIGRISAMGELLQRAFGKVAVKFEVLVVEEGAETH